MKDLLILLTVILSAIIIWMMTYCNGSETIIEKYDNQYIKGEIYRASSSNYNNGLVRVFVDEAMNAEKRLWGLPYSGYKDFNRFDEVYFKVKNIAGIDIAYDIKENAINSVQPNTKDYLGTNLHAGHEEYTAHSKLHVIRTLSETENLTKVAFQQHDIYGNPLPPPSIIEIHLRTVHFNSLDHSLKYFANLVGIENNIEVYELNVNHVH